MNIQLTPAARERMQNFLEAQPNAAGVRFGVRKTGCSGYAYIVEIADSIGADDRIVEQDGIKLVVDRKSIPYVDGTQIDFARQGLNASFVFRNPNVTGECGCGESFTVEDQGLRTEG
jgi:iron-sulfur cluster assembly protein